MNGADAPVAVLVSGPDANSHVRDATAATEAAAAASGQLQYMDFFLPEVILPTLQIPILTLIFMAVQFIFISVNVEESHLIYSIFL